MKHTILCVDDEPDTVDSLGRLFRKKYKVLKATSGVEALGVLKENSDISLIISDQRMPEMTGVEFLTDTLDLVPDAIRILLTGYTDIDSVIGAINSGQIYRYITKPWDPVDLTATVDQAIEKFELRSELQKKNVELSQALTELQTLDQAKTDFMLLINHELKTPLTSLLSFLSLLKESKLDDEQNLYCKRISQSADRLNELIEKVLLLIKAQTGTLEIHLQKVSLKEAIEKNLEQRNHEVGKKKLQVKIDGDGSTSADAKVLSTVISEIIGNAIKFADAESVLQINVENNRASVENLGPDIPAEKLTNLLKPFTLDENAMNHTTGLGLGLNLCQALLKALSSELEITSESGKTKVSFELKG